MTTLLRTNQPASTTLLNKWIGTSAQTARRFATATEEHDVSQGIAVKQVLNADGLFFVRLREMQLAVAKLSIRSTLGKRATYLDAQATTPMDFRVTGMFSKLFYFQPRVLHDADTNFVFQYPDAMLPYMLQNFGNPHSRSHSYGWEAEAAVEKARSVCIYLTMVSTLYLLIIETASCDSDRS